MITRFSFIHLFVLAAFHGYAQDSSRVFFTTGAGVFSANHQLNDVLKPAISFNSGLEITNKNDWFLLGTVDFIALQYNQQVKDEASPYLFQNTGSSLLLLGLNGGKNFPISETWFVSGYVGGGYLNIGEPRLTLKNNIITQEVRRAGSGFGRIGSRLACKTKISFLQTLYCDISWLGSPVSIQAEKLNGFSFFIGLRMGR